MSSLPPNLSLPLPTVTTAPLAIYTALLPSPSALLVASSSAATAPPAAAYTAEEITGVLNLVTAIHGISCTWPAPTGRR